MDATPPSPVSTIVHPMVLRESAPPPGPPVYWSLLQTDSPHRVGVALLGELKWEIVDRALKTRALKMTERAALLVLLFLLSFVDEVEFEHTDKMLAAKSVREIMEGTGLKRTAVFAARRILQDRGFLHMQPGTGHRTTTFEITKPPDPRLSGGPPERTPGARRRRPRGSGTTDPWRAPRKTPGARRGEPRGSAPADPHEEHSLFSSDVVVKDNNTATACAAMLREIGFDNEPQIAKIVGSPHCTLVQIAVARQLCESQPPGTVKNRLGWIRTAIENGYTRPPSQRERRRESLPEHVQELNAAGRERDAAARAEEAGQLEKLRAMADTDLRAAMESVIAEHPHEWMRSHWRRTTPGSLLAGLSPSFRAAVLAKVGTCS